MGLKLRIIIYIKVTMSDSNHSEIIANTDNYKYAIDVNEAGAKTFHSCDTKEKYIDIMKKSKHMYEILSSELRKPYFDFDKFNKTPDQVDGLLFEIKNLYNQTFNNTPVTDDNMKVTYRKDTEKINVVSLHVVIDNGTYGTKEQLHAFAKNVRDSCERTTDIGVYDKNRSFKMPNMSKFGTNKISKIYNKYEGCPYDEVMKHHINIRDTTGFTQLQLKSDTPVNVTAVVKNVPTPDTKNNTLTFRDTGITYTDNDDDTIDMLTPELENMGFSGIVKVSKYGFDCDQRRGDKCPLCDSTHRKNQFYVYKTAIGSYFVKSHSQKCVKTKIKGEIVFTEQEQKLIDNGESEEYMAMKKVFEGEQNVSKIVNNLLFSVADGQFVSRSQLIERTEDMILPGNISFIQKWLKDDTKKRFTSLNFLPGGSAPDIYNTWRGYKVADITRKPGKVVDIEWFHTLVKSLTGGEVTYFIQWLAHLFQKPGEKPRTALVFKSGQGFGKNSIFTLIGNMMGNNLCNFIGDADNDLFSRFTDALENRKMIVIDEAEAKKHSRALKGIITNPETRCEKKGQQAYTISNYAGVVFLTNKEMPVDIESDDRRYVVYKSDATLKNVKEFWEPFWTKYVNNDDVHVAVYDYLMSIDISGIDWIHDRPMIDTYNQIRESSLSYEIKFISHLIVEAFPPTKNNKVSGVDMYDYYEQYTRNKTHDVTKAVFGRRLSTLLADENIFSEGEQNHNVFHKIRNKQGIVWQIDRELAFEWLKKKKYTTATELTDITDVNNYSFFSTL